MAHDVFISYSHVDKPTADAVCATLESRGIRCWIAPRDVLPGDDYASSLVGAIHASRLLVLVFSSVANQSPQVLREVERAVSKGLPILPLRIEDVALSPAMEYYISSRHWLDAMTAPLERHLVALADTVTLLLQRTPGGAPASAPPSPGPTQAVRPVPPVIEDTPGEATAEPSAPRSAPQVAEPAPPPPAPRPIPATAAPAATPADPQRRRVALASLVVLLFLGIGLGQWQMVPASALGLSSVNLRTLGFLHLLLFGLACVAAGFWLRRAEPRRIVMTAGLLFGVGNVLAGLGMGPAGGGVLMRGGAGGVVGSFVLGLVCLAGVGAGLGYVTVITTLLRWFPDRRGMIAGAATAAFAAGAAGASRLVWWFGVYAFTVLGAVALVAVSLAARRLRNPAPDYAPLGTGTDAGQLQPNASRTLRQALRAWQWYALAAVLLLGPFTAVLTGSSLREASGMAGATVLITGMVVLGRLLWGSLANRLGARRVIVTVLAAQALLLFLMPDPREGGAGAIALPLSVIFFGGGLVAGVPVLTAEYFGMADLGAVYGVMQVGWCVGSWLASVGAEALGVSRPARVLVVVLLLAAAFVAMRLRPPRGASPAAT